MYTTLAAVKAALNIPPEETSHDARLQELITQASIAADAWAGRSFRQRRYHETIRPASTVYRTSTPIELVLCALREALCYLGQFVTPAWIVREERPRIEKWLASAEAALQKDPDGICLFTRELVRLESLTLRGRVCVRFAVERVNPSHVTFSRELVIEVIRLGEGAIPHQRLDMILLFEPWSGPSIRSSLPRRARTLMMPYTRRRLYLPHSHVGQLSWDSLIGTVVALMLLYLTQGGLVSVDEDQTVREWLLAYLGRFRGAREVGAHRILGELLAHYRMPEDYRAFTKYVKQTIRGLMAEEGDKPPPDVLQDPDTAECYYPVPAAAMRLGISPRRLYELIKSGRARIAEVRIGQETYRAIPRDELSRLEDWYARRHVRQQFIRWLARTRHIQLASARRDVERAEKRGYSLEDLVRRFPEFRDEVSGVGNA